MYFIVEIQNMADGTCAHLVETAVELNDAYSKFYMKLAYAAISALPCHAVTMFSSDGAPIKHEAFWHPIEEPTPVEPEEPEEPTEPEGE